MGSDSIPVNRRLAQAGRAWLVIFLSWPAALLAIAGYRNSGTNGAILWSGAALQALVCCWLSLNPRRRTRRLGSASVMLYLFGLTWMWFTPQIEDWYSHLARGILLVVPLVVFGYQTLHESGAPALRRANVLARRLAQRKDWPTDLQSCRSLSEVKAFRAALALDAAPALALLNHDRPETRMAALAALEFRKEWSPGQAEMVLQFAQRCDHPELRAAAVTALGNVEDRTLVETLAQFLHDPNAGVRAAAVEALLWDTERRWNWMRQAVRRILADPLFANDGPLVHDGQLLTSEAVNDLTAWCAEKGVLAARAAQTLASHFSRSMSEQHDPELAARLRRQLADPHHPAVLRLELARVLQSFQELDDATVKEMLTPSNPSPMRLIACETILGSTEVSSNRLSALAALRDLARLPNREIALAAADVVQRRLGVDLGLGLGQPLPTSHSRQAAEITRRVLQWANQADLKNENVENSQFLANSGVGIPL